MCFPVTSITFAARGVGTSAPPIATIFPPSNTIVPFGIVPRVTVWIVAPRSTTGCDCFATGIVTCAPAASAASAAAPRSAAPATRDSVFIACISVPSPARPARRTIGRGVGVHRAAGGEHRLDELTALARDLGTQRRILLEREVAAAVDPRLLRPGELRERVAAPDHEVGVLPRLERAHAVVDRDRLGCLVHDGGGR